MEILGRQSLFQLIRNLESRAEYQQMLGVLLKYEIQMLLQRLAETGEESVVMTMSVADGTLSMIGSEYGEKFIQDPGRSCGVVTDFKEQFVRYCHNVCSRKRNDSVNEINDDSEEHSNNSPPINSYTSYSKRCGLRRTRSGNKKQMDKTDQTVAELVKNIMKRTKEKENSNERVCIRGARSPRGRKRHVVRSDFIQMQNQMLSNCDDSLNQAYYEVGNKEVDETVSKLVENIKAQAEVKEKQKLQTRRKYKRKLQGRHDFDRELEVFSHSTGSSKRPKCIADCFPTLSDSLETTSAFDTSVETVIKIEPCDNGYEYVLNNNAETSSELENIEIVHDERESEPCSEYTETVSVGECSNETADLQQTDMRQTDDLQNFEDSNTEITERMIQNGTGVCKEQTESGTEFDVTNLKIEIDSDFEEIELPFVEEYYDKKNWQPEKMLVSEKSTCTDQVDADSCYKISGRRPGKYNLIHRGYCYIKDKEGKGNTVYWKCGRFRCKGRVIQRNGENIRTQDHNHLPTLMFESKKKKLSNRVTW